MTIDKEQVRRDALLTEAEPFLLNSDWSGTLARGVVALLAELEQAEREIARLKAEVDACENALSETRL